MRNNLQFKPADGSETKKSLRETLEEQMRLSREKELRATPLPELGEEPDYKGMSLHEEMEARKKRLLDEELRDEILALRKKDAEAVAESAKNSDESSFGTKLADLTGTAAQAASYGFSDEINGLIGGAGETLAYPFLKGKEGYNRSSAADAFQNGYEEYRDYTRDRLNNAQENMPVAATAAETAGTFLAPSKILPLKNEPMFTRNILSNAQKYAIGRGVANGIGESEGTDINDYANNITRNVSGNLMGSQVGTHFLGKKFGSAGETINDNIGGKFGQYFSNLLKK